MRRCGVALLFLLMLAWASASWATDLRGRVEGQTNYSPTPFPLNGARVELMDAGGQRSIATTYAGPDGFYYFRAVAPGAYAVRVEGRLYRVAVEAGRFQDIPPIRVRR